MKQQMDGISLDTIHEQIEMLKALFPEAVKEGVFDPETLVGLLEEHDDTLGLNEERYDFTWKGKAESLRLAQRRSEGTLRPSIESSRDWETTGNIYIEGDNLEVMKLLQQGYLRSVKMIYIDPPYNTGNDFVYQDDFTDPIAGYKQITGQGMRANPETAGRYHSAWLSMMYPRLRIAKTLLRDDGVIFISIDDNENHNLRKLCDEIFGEENFVSEIVWQRSKKGDAKLIAGVHEYILCYARKKETLIEAGVWRRKKEGVDEVLATYAEYRRRFSGDHMKIREAMQVWYRGLDNDDPGKKHKHYNWSDDRGLYFADNFAGPDDGRASRPRHDIIHPVTGKPCKKPSTGWRWDEARTRWALEQSPPRIHFGPDETTIPNRKSYLAEIDSEPYSSVFYRDGRSATLEVESLIGKGVFPFPKNTEIIAELIDLTTGPNDLVLDFFSGSGTTAHAVMQLNATDGGGRKFICIQIPEPLFSESETRPSSFASIADIGRERVRRAGDRVLAEWRERHGKEAGTLFRHTSEEISPPDVGFRVFRLDSSNLQKWDGSYVLPDNANLFLERIQNSLDNMKPDRSDMDMVYEVLLKYGVPLTDPLVSFQVRGKTFHSVGDTGYLLICLDKGITVEIVEELVASHVPGAVVFSDECFADDSELTNAGLVLDKAQIEFRWI